MKVRKLAIRAPRSHLFPCNCTISIAITMLNPSKIICLLNVLICCSLVASNLDVKASGTIEDETQIDHHETQVQESKSILFSSRSTLSDSSNSVSDRVKASLEEVNVRRKLSAPVNKKRRKGKKKRVRAEGTGEESSENVSGEADRTASASASYGGEEGVTSEGGDGQSNLKSGRSKRGKGGERRARKQNSNRLKGKGKGGGSDAVSAGATMDGDDDAKRGDDDTDDNTKKQKAAAATAAANRDKKSADGKGRGRRGSGSRRRRKREEGEAQVNEEEAEGDKTSSTWDNTRSSESGSSSSSSNSASSDGFTEWMQVPMPKKSLFAGSGFKPPDDMQKWRQAQQAAHDGKKILLQNMLKVIKSPTDFLTGEKKFKWMHRISDACIHRGVGFEILSNFTGYRAPIAMIGCKAFDRKDFEGNEIRTYSYGPGEVLNALATRKTKIPRAFVAIGNMDENWGWASTYFLNRTISWGFSFDRRLGPMRAQQTEELLPFLDNPKVIMLLLNQHHNISHPKVISLPRGVLPTQARKIFDEAMKSVRLDTRKNTLLFSASSSWGPRPFILSCVKDLMGDDIYVPDASVLDKKGRMEGNGYIRMLSDSMAVLCVPGLGYDTFRLWEALASGSMPVLEKGVGFDRVLYKIPALLLDDFAEITPMLIRQAYVEALYRADEWDYKRITQRWWERLLIKVSETGSAATLLRLHPYTAEDSGFTRPMVPFNCVKMGGCGFGTKRVPTRSCAIDLNYNMSKFNWYEIHTFYIDSYIPMYIYIYTFHHSSLLIAIFSYNFKHTHITPCFCSFICTITLLYTIIHPYYTPLYYIQLSTIRYWEQFITWPNGDPAPGYEKDSTGKNISSFHLLFACDAMSMYLHSSMDHAFN